MKNVYVDSEFHCHINNPDGAYKEVETDFFDGKCQTFVEGYCYDDSKGYVQVYPWKPYSELEVVQREYERELLTDAKNALAILLGGEV